MDPLVSRNGPGDSFRDQLATIDKKGKRIWVYARQTSGRLTRLRTAFGWLLLLFFLSAPFIRMGGEQLLLFDFFNRKFVLFGIHFWPQDFHLFFLAMIALMVFVIFFTVIYGRLWCGWACPQTILMELVYRKIEYWIDGSPGKQRELERSPWTAAKVLKRVSKHGIFFGISFVFGNVLLMYLIGTDSWKELVTDDPSRHLAGLTGMLVFAFLIYFIYAWFREQVCTIVCPYGRLQGVLLDRSSIVISYDYVRGEPRAPFARSADRAAAGQGECVDCLQCVQVCPTGIDIRNGTQLECINCGNCIDACNGVMRRFGFRPGLIRYASEKMIAERGHFKPTGRATAYSAVLALLIILTAYFLVSRNPVEATLLRTPGMLYQKMENNRIGNLYTLKLINKTNEAYPVSLRLLSHAGEIRLIGNPVSLEKQSQGETVFFILLDKSTLRTAEEKIRIGVFSGDRKLDEAKATFIGPDLNLTP